MHPKHSPAQIPLRSGHSSAVLCRAVPYYALRRGGVPCCAVLSFKRSTVSDPRSGFPLFTLYRYIYTLVKTATFDTFPSRVVNTRQCYFPAFVDIPVSMRRVATAARCPHMYVVENKAESLLKQSPTPMASLTSHCNLVLSPDDVWLTILSQFCAYVNNNAEGLRSKIVEHEGKKELKAYCHGTLETADYKGMIRDLLMQIRENIKSPELADWFRPGFSTTTEKEEVCAAATAMASLQAYFEFTMCLTCGIPSVTMLGTVADWKLLREKIDRLLEFEVEGNPEGKVMELWVGYLRQVCDGFVESAEHPRSAKTLEFWDKVGCVAYMCCVCAIIRSLHFVPRFACVARKLQCRIHDRGKLRVLNL